MTEAIFDRPTFPQMYERFLVQPLFRPWVDDLLDRVRLAQGDRLLDVACGTGIVARVAKARLGERGKVVGVDVSADMIAVARSVAPEIEWRVGSAMALPIDVSGTFTVVVCQQGLQFFNDKPAAVREMRRVLAPRGRVAIATWRPLGEAPFLLALHEVAERHLGPVADRRHSFGQAGPLRMLLEEAGFAGVQVETITRTTHFDDPAMFVRMNALALVGMSSESGARSEDERGRLAETIAGESADVLPAYADGPGISFAMSTNLATAHL